MPRTAPAKSSRATCRSRPPPMISVGWSICFKGSIGSSVKAEAMPGCIDGGIESPGGGGSTICPAMMASIALAIGANMSGANGLFKLRLEQVALPPRGGGQQDQAVDGDAPRGQDRDQPALAVSDQNDFREFPAAAQIIHQRDRIVDIVLEAKILRPAEFRLPSAGAALVVAQRRDLARDQLLGEFLQGRGLDLRSVAVMVGRAGARDQQRDRRLLDIRRHRQHRIDGADAESCFPRRRRSRPSPNRPSDRERENDRSRRACATRSSAPLPAA